MQCHGRRALIAKLIHQEIVLAAQQIEVSRKAVAFHEVVFPYGHHSACMAIRLAFEGSGEYVKARSKLLHAPRGLGLGVERGVTHNQAFIVCEALGKGGEPFARRWHACGFHDNDPIGFGSLYANG